MNDTPIDYTAVLRDLEEKRAQIDAAIEVIRPFAGQGDAASAPNGASAGTVGGEIREDSFFGLSAMDAAAKFLSMVKKAQGTKEIVAAIVEGGYKSTAKNLYSNVYTGLTRDDRFSKIGKGKWGLTEWYPGLKNKKAQVGEAKSDDSLKDEGIDEEGNDSVAAGGDES